jgi:hypothetical protein
MATSKSRVTRTPAHWKEALIEQVSLLMEYSAAFDRGTTAMVKPMSASLRLLLHTNPSPRSNTRAVLDHFKLRSGRWFDVAGTLPPNVVTPISGLVQTLSTAGDPSAGHQIPRFGSDDKWIRGIIRTPFVQWWTGPIARGFDREPLSRMDLVREIADTDGGAHVDASRSANYESVLDGSYSSATLMVDGANMSAGWHTCAMRSISHEVILTLNRYAPWSLTRPYVWPNLLEPSKPFSTDTWLEVLASYQSQTRFHR